MREDFQEVLGHLVHASSVPKLEGGLSGDVVGFGPFGTRLLVPKLEEGFSRDVAGFGSFGTRLY